MTVQLRFNSGHEQLAQLVFEVGATGQADNEDEGDGDHEQAASDAEAQGYSPSGRDRKR